MQYTYNLCSFAVDLELPIRKSLVFSKVRPYLTVALMQLQCCVRVSVCDVCIVAKQCVLEQQESCAIAKMTARCALYK